MLNKWELEGQVTSCRDSLNDRKERIGRFLELGVIGGAYSVYEASNGAGSMTQVAIGDTVRAEGVLKCKAIAGEHGTRWGVTLRAVKVSKVK